MYVAIKYLQAIFPCLETLVLLRQNTTQQKIFLIKCSNDKEKTPITTRLLYVTFFNTKRGKQLKFNVFSLQCPSIYQRHDKYATVSTSPVMVSVSSGPQVVNRFSLSPLM